MNAPIIQPPDKERIAFLPPCRCAPETIIQRVREAIQRQQKSHLEPNLSKQVGILERDLACAQKTIERLRDRLQE